MAKQVTKKTRRKLSESMKARWQGPEAQSLRSTLTRAQRVRQLRAPKARRDCGLAPYPTDNHLLESNGLETNPVAPLPTKPARPYTRLWRLAWTVQEAGSVGITAGALAQAVEGYSTEEYRDATRKALSVLMNRHRYPIVRRTDGRYQWLVSCEVWD